MATQILFTILYFFAIVVPTSMAYRYPGPSSPQTQKRGRSLGDGTDLADVLIRARPWQQISNEVTNTDFWYCMLRFDFIGRRRRANTKRYRTQNYGAHKPKHFFEPMEMMN